MSRVDLFRQLNQVPIHIEAKSFVADMLFWGMYENEWWRNYLHVHSFFEVCYVFAGQGTFLIHNQIHTVQTGDIFIARPGQYHEIIASEDDPLGIYFWAYTLSVPETEDDITTLLNTYAQAPDFLSQRVGQIPILCDLLVDEIHRREAGYVESIHALTIKLLLETARSVTDVSANTDAESDSQSTVVREVIHYIKDNYHQPIQIRDIAAQVHMSERHVSRLFHEATTKTIKTYLTDLRLEKACQILLKSDIPITEVALQTGYPDMRYFSTLFRRQFGITPTTFRNQNGTQYVD